MVDGFRDTRCPYPEEYDYPEYCGVCLRNTDDCDCPECPVCASVGDPHCYDLKHLECAADSVKAFCDHIGIYPIKECLRAIDKYNLEHVWLVLWGPHPRTGVERVYYHDTASLDFTPGYLRLRALGVGAIPWDGTNAEFSEECDISGGWELFDKSRDDVKDWYDEHEAQTRDEEAEFDPEYDEGFFGGRESAYLEDILKRGSRKD